MELIICKIRQNNDILVATIPKDSGLKKGDYIKINKVEQ